jgi:polysaccharide biosynthesis transport protein
MMWETAELREAYDALFSGLRLGACSDIGKSILITSTQPHEGKTTVASCLAITASLAGQTALLIDGDLRRPWLASAAGLDGAAGFGEILEGQCDGVEVTHRVELFDDGREKGLLSVMAAGRKSATFLPTVDWAKARVTLRSLSERFGVVFVDSPPILAVNDALLLAGVVDAVLLVVGAGSADRDEVRRAKEHLDPVGTPVVGAVLNQFNAKVHGRPHHPYRGYYLGSRP